MYSKNRLLFNVTVNIRIFNVQASYNNDIVRILQNTIERVFACIIVIFMLTLIVLFI